MKPPRCRACGVEEWRHVCAPAALGVTEQAAAPAAKPRVSHASPVSQSEATTYRYRDVEARREYQRDLMRSRRRAARRNSAGVA